jgi:hypothetical protein
MDIVCDFFITRIGTEIMIAIGHGRYDIDRIPRPHFLLQRLDECPGTEGTGTKIRGVIKSQKQ